MEAQAKKEHLISSVSTVKKVFNNNKSKKHSVKKEQNVPRPKAMSSGTRTRSF